MKETTKLPNTLDELKNVMLSKNISTCLSKNYMITFLSNDVSTPCSLWCLQTHIVIKTHWTVHCKKCVYFITYELHQMCFQSTTKVIGLQVTGEKVNLLKFFIIISKSPKIIPELKFTAV